MNAHSLPYATNIWQRLLGPCTGYVSVELRRNILPSTLRRATINAVFVFSKGINTYTSHLTNSTKDKDESL